MTSAVADPLSASLHLGNPIPSGSMRSLRSTRRKATELDVDLHSSSSHSRRSTRSVLSLRSLKPAPAAAAGVGSIVPPTPVYNRRGFVNYEDTDGETSSDDFSEDDDDSNDSCSSFAESTNDCVANNKYLRRGMSIEIGALDLCDLDVSEFDDHALDDANVVMDEMEQMAEQEKLLLTAKAPLAASDPESPE